MAGDPTSADTLAHTALHALHVSNDGRMVDFAGYDMPVQYEGVLAEHEASRTSAGLFDVGHMGIVDLHDGGTDPAEALETLVPASITRLGEQRSRYTMLTNDAGGIIDDLIVTRLPDRLRLVVNASRRATDLAHLRAHLPSGVDLIERTDLTLVALQGPESENVLAELDPDVQAIDAFMRTGSITLAGQRCDAARSGYTGEDGFELALPVDTAHEIAELLLTDQRVTPAGLGARDTLRLEAGLCLYGNDLDEATTPVEADLAWSIQRRRREEGGFLGAEVIQRQLAQGTDRIRVGIRAEGRRPIRDGAPLLVDDAPVGRVTSGGHGPTFGGPVAMGYLPPSLSTPGTALVADVRGKTVPCVVAELPFVPHRYRRS